MLLYALFVAFPIWWVLGLGAFVWPILALPMLASLVLRRDVRAPRGFGIWLAFLVWMAGSALMLDEPTRGLVFIYRASLYLSATILFLYVYNSTEEQLPTGRILLALGVFWAYVVAGGYLGVLFSEVSFSTPVESIVPGRFMANEWFSQLVHPRFAQIHDFLGYPVGRPAAPFVYTNEWGANFALLTPLLIASWSFIRRWGWRPITIALLVASAVPIVMSLNRGLWLSLGLGLLYASWRFALLGRGTAFGGVLLLFAVLGLVIAFTPLRELVADRLVTGHSNRARISLASEAGEGVLQSPLLGYGSPRPSAENPNLPSVGTQGQLWLVLFSHGVPGALFYVGWFAYVAWISRRGGSWATFWSHVTLVIVLLQLPYYGMLPSQIHVVMLASAIALRERRAFTEAVEATATAGERAPAAAGAG
ncbi:MAG TPA: hypothetical protein VJN50_06835 [Actinomycetota bacterium]|nr:hypothetical protein [Actinomycetota bacterium]